MLYTVFGGVSPSNCFIFALSLGLVALMVPFRLTIGGNDCLFINLFNSLPMYQANTTV